MDSNKFPNQLNNQDNKVTNSSTPQRSSPELLNNYIADNIKQASSQISASTPFAQTEILNKNIVNAQENFSKINHNLKQIIDNVRIITSKLGPISGFPCEISKFVTTKVCDINTQFEKLSSIVTPKIDTGLQKLQVLSEKSLDDSQNLLDQVSKSTNSVGENLAKLTDNTSKMGETVNILSKKKDKSKIQSGGSRKENRFEYIINPMSGRKVHVKSNLGRKIILSYISNCN